MVTKIIDLKDIELVDFFGVNEKNLKFLELLYPKVQLVQRGNTLKIIGLAKDVKEFETAFALLLTAFEKNGTMNEKIIMHLAKPLSDIKPQETAAGASNILVHGRNGLLVKAQSPSQKIMVAEIEKKDMLFAIGPAGSGKTYTAVALAVRA
jgi:Phosphate starvation-inducible protein PhoH, predicted ATPase